MQTVIDLWNSGEHGQLLLIALGTTVCCTFLVGLWLFARSTRTERLRVTGKHREDVEMQLMPGCNGLPVLIPIGGYALHIVELEDAEGRAWGACVTRGEYEDLRAGDSMEALIESYPVIGDCALRLLRKC